MTGRQRRVILLTGYAGAGKDTVGAILRGGYDFCSTAIAHALKDRTAEKYGIPREYFDDREKKDAPLLHLPVVASDLDTAAIQCILSSELHPRGLPRGQGTDEGVPQAWTPRALLILEGSTARAVSPGYWVDQVVREMGDWPGLDFAVTDVRYRSEIEQLKVSYPGARIVRVTRAEVSESTSASERDLDGYPPDLVIWNRGTLADLEVEVEKALEVLYAGE